MIVWLASYPRSGNTLLRMVLKHCFGVPSYSLYSDQEFPLSAVQEIVGEKPLGNDPQKFLSKSRAEGAVACVKTHELPGPDRHRAIYIVRDGRAALVSHYHYFRDVLGLRVTLEEVIRAEIFTSWSTHVTAWMLSGRSDVLVVRFESLVCAQPETLSAIGRFLGVGCRKPFTTSFSALHALMPKFFRSGSNISNIAEMTDSELALFKQLHGKVSEMVGYSTEIPTVSSAAFPRRA